MNQTMKDFLERNGINADKIPEKMNMDLTTPNIFNIYMNYYNVQKPQVKKYVCIEDIIGSDAFRCKDNIYDLMEHFFDERGDGYHRRSTDLLEISSEDIMKQLKISFSDDPIILAEYDGKYFVRTNGNHRVFAMYLNYLLEKQEVKTPQELEKLKEKYTFPAYVMEIDAEKSYANYILQSRSTGRYIGREFDPVELRYSDNYEIVDNGERRTVKDDKEIDDFIRNNFMQVVKNKDSTLLIGMSNAAKKHESFRKYFSRLYPEIGEQDISKSLLKIGRSISYRDLDLSKAESIGDILTALTHNETLLNKQKTTFDEFIKTASKSDEQIDKLFEIMGIVPDERLNIDKLEEKFAKITYTIEDMFNEADRVHSSRLYSRAEAGLTALSSLDFGKLSEEYRKKGITELKEKIASRALELQSKSQIKELDKKKKEEALKKFGLWDKIRGKQRLRDSTIANLDLQRQYLERTMHTPKSMEEAVRDLYNYMKVHGENEQIKDFMERLRKLDKESAIINLDEICIEAFLPVKRNQKKLSPRKQAAKLEEESKAMEEKILSTKGPRLSQQIKVDDSTRRVGVLKRVERTIKEAESKMSLDGGPSIISIREHE